MLHPLVRFTSRIAPISHRRLPKSYEFASRCIRTLVPQTIFAFAQEFPVGTLINLRLRMRKLAEIGIN